MIYDYCIIIGRFQPVHLGHKALIDEACARAKKVLVVVGSDSKERTRKNPWLIPERRKMLRLLYPNGQKVALTSACDFPGNNEAWMRGVLCQASRYMEQDAKARMLMLTCEKEGTWVNELRELFFEITVEEMQSPHDMLHATELRDRYFNLNLWGLRNHVPQEIFEYLTAFYDTAYFWAAYDAYHEAEEEAAA